MPSFINALTLPERFGILLPQFRVVGLLFPMTELDLFNYAMMGEGVEFDKFIELEEKIKLMIQEQSSLKRRNKELEELLKQKEIELQESIEKNRGLNEERETVRLKIDSLLDLLKDIKGI